MFDSARIVEAPDTEYQPDAAALEEEVLERARPQVAARWASTLSIDGDEIRLVHGSDLYPDGPHPEKPTSCLKSAPCTANSKHGRGDRRRWRLGRRFLPSEASSCACVSAAVRTAFLAAARPCRPAFREERDRAAFVRFLERGLPSLLAGLLADDGRDGRMTGRLRSNRIVQPRCKSSA